jgi:hypothetical protein
LPERRLADQTVSVQSSDKRLQYGSVSDLDAEFMGEPSLSGAIRAAIDRISDSRQQSDVKWVKVNDRRKH